MQLFLVSFLRVVVWAMNYKTRNHLVPGIAQSGTNIIYAARSSCQRKHAERRAVPFFYYKFVFLQKRTEQNINPHCHVVFFCFCFCQLQIYGFQIQASRAGCRASSIYWGLYLHVIQRNSTVGSIKLPKGQFCRIFFTFSLVLFVLTFGFIVDNWGEKS